VVPAPKGRWTKLDAEEAHNNQHRPENETVRDTNDSLAPDARCCGLVAVLILLVKIAVKVGAR